jgi:hypothetical protein
MRPRLRLQPNAAPAIDNRRATCEACELAASPDAPEGLGEALASGEANEKRRACQDKVEKVANDVRVMSAVGNAVGVAGGMAGSSGKAAVKAAAVMVQGKVMRARVGQLSACDAPADRVGVPHRS